MRNVAVKRNRYVDSVTLMTIEEKVMKLSGVENVEVKMGTPANKEVFEGAGYNIEENVQNNDLVIAITGDADEVVAGAIKLVEDILDRRVDDEDTVIYSSLDEIDMQTDPYDLVQISLPGEFAFDEAMKALEKNLDVFIFSDNVSIEEELELKRFGSEKGLLVMGPDCGVGLINGVALAAGSIIRKGRIGIVGASGSGAQEVSCIIEKCGYGVSSIIGTGGRDLYPEIGGITMLDGLARLTEDKNTDVIVLVSKLADLKVMDKVLSAADEVDKPVVAVFLGSDEKLFENHKVHGVFSLEDAALKAVGLYAGKTPDFGLSDESINEIVNNELRRYSSQQKYLRGLFCGGTFTEETMIYFNESDKNLPLNSNLKTRFAEQLESHNISLGHTILDLGSEDFTIEAPHPVFEPAIRLKRFEKEMMDPEVAVIMLDFITGPGVHLNPIDPFIEAFKKLKQKRKEHVTIISTICGSSGDPQNVLEKEELLKDAGIIVTKSNYQSTKLAFALVEKLEGKV